MRLLIIEDEAAIAEPLTSGLRKRGFAVDWLDNGKKGYRAATIDNYDCIILDLNLPDLDGMAVLRNWRKEGIITPVLILTARSNKESLLDGFKCGSDDYMAKPFDFRELVYRVNSLIKRNSYNKEEVINIGHLAVDLKTLKVYKDKQSIKLNNKELGILEYLIRNRGKIISQEELLEHVWDREVDSLSQTVRTNIKTLRKKIDPEKELIKNIKGRGYCIEK